MVSVHRRLVASIPGRAKAVLLDTPFGFQENCAELSARAVDYFAKSVNIDLEVAGLARLSDTHIPADPTRVESGLRAMENADYLFAGPGSPTYALRQWTGTRVADIVRAKLRDGGVVVFASAAAVTLGRAAVPVYEIYKVGHDVTVLPGLDVLADIGIDAVVVPHWNNAEGAGHDTRFCYLGAARLAIFESMLEPGTWILGIDEHTALVCDLAADTATVMGNGTVTIRTRDHERVIASGETVALDLLRDPWTRGDGPAIAPSRERPAAGAGAVDVADASLSSVADRLRGDFRRAVEARDARAATRAVLDLEQAIADWSSDTLQGPDMGSARDALRAMVSELGEVAASGIGDPREAVAPYVETLLSLREAARAEKRWEAADVIRERFAALGVEVRDTPDGSTWHLSTDSD